MKKIFVNQQNNIRNGWWIAIFIGLIVLTQFIYRPITQGLRELNVLQEIIETMPIILVWLVTFICLRVRNESIKTVGMAMNRRWFKEFIIGIIGGCVWLFAVVFCLWLVGGVSFVFNHETSIGILVSGFYAFLIAALLEEILHRGFIFQRLINGLGFWQAQLIIAMIFAFGHLGNPEMDGISAVRAFIDLAIASLIFGLVYWRTNSLALPIGLHLGWNWAQGNIMGFNVSGYETSSLFQATLSNQPQWLTGGKFGLEGSLFSILLSIIVFIVILRWRGSSQVVIIKESRDIKRITFEKSNRSDISDKNSITE